MAEDQTQPFEPYVEPDFVGLAEADDGAEFGDDGYDLDETRTEVEEAIPAPPPIDGVDARRVLLDPETGVEAETFAPTNAGPHPALVWLHGGGYVIGAPEMGGNRLQSWAGELGCFAMSVDYRLAPEHPFPAAHDDAFRALEWLVDNADELDVDVDRIVVAGASAGGGLAAGLALAARDRGIPLAGQLLFYPMLDDRQQTRSSTWAAPVWSQSANESAWRAYLGGTADDVSPYAAPARADDVAGLPPTMVIVGGADRFVDEDLTYGSRLVHAGVPTDVRLYCGAPHGFDVVGDASSIAAAAVDDAEAWLRRRFGG